MVFESKPLGGPSLPPIADRILVYPEPSSSVGIRDRGRLGQQQDQLSTLDETVGHMTLPNKVSRLFELPARKTRTIER